MGNPSPARLIHAALYGRRQTPLGGSSSAGAASPPSSSSVARATRRGGGVPQVGTPSLGKSQFCTTIQAISMPINVKVSMDLRHPV
jgi:hypothetical protein